MMVQLPSVDLTVDWHFKLEDLVMTARMMWASFAKTGEA